MKKSELKELIKEVLNEHPDGIRIKATQERIADWSEGDARAFGYYKNKMYVSDTRGAHFEILDNYKGEENIDPKDYQRRIGREYWKYAGRIWTKLKIVSFWDYPPLGQLKKTLQDLQKELKSKWGVNINTMSFKIDIPATIVDKSGNIRGSSYKDVEKMGSKGWEGDSYLYSVQNVLKPGFELKGQGKQWKKSGSEIQTPKDIQHQIPAMLRTGAAVKLNPEQKKALSDYFARKGSLTKDEKRMWDMIARNKKIQRETREFIREHLSKYRKTKIINESPDAIAVGHGDDSPKHLWHWISGINHAFGYKGNKMYVSYEDATHASIGGRSTLKYAGRIWIDKKVISFWTYPPLNKLKGVLKDIEDTFNKSFNVDSAFSRHRGKLKITNDWKIDIPAETGLGVYGSTSYSKLVGLSGLKVSDFGFSKAYLYKLSTVFSNKPLKGIGEELKGGKEITAKGVDIQHHLPPMLKKGAAVKLNPEQKKALSDYFAKKGSLSREEQHMWKIIARNMGLKESEIFGKVFTLEEGSGILTEAPHITVGNKSIDLEFEQGKLQALKRILNIILGNEVIDKYGNRFKLTSAKEVFEFVKLLSKNYQVKSELR